MKRTLIHQESKTLEGTQDVKFKFNEYASDEPQLDELESLIIWFFLLFKIIILMIE